MKEENKLVQGTLIKTRDDSFIMLIGIPSNEMNQIFSPTCSIKILQAMKFNDSYLLCEVIDEETVKADEIEQKIRDIETLKESAEEKCNYHAERCELDLCTHNMCDLWKGKIEAFSQALDLLRG